MLAFQALPGKVSGTPNRERQGAPAPQREQIRFDQVDMIFITKGTVLEGALQSGSPIEVEGFVKGTIRSQMDVTISGRVEGDLEVGSLTAEGATIVGDISCAASAEILSGSQVQGNIDAERVVISACVRGDITARESVALESDAVVLGNINTKFFQSARGAYVNGIITTTNDVKEEKLFDRIKAKRQP